MISQETQKKLADYATNKGMILFDASEIKLCVDNPDEVVNSSYTQNYTKDLEDETKYDALFGRCAAIELVKNKCGHYSLINGTHRIFAAKIAKARVPLFKDNIYQGLICDACARTERFELF